MSLEAPGSRAIVRPEHGAGLVTRDNERVRLVAERCSRGAKRSPPATCENLLAVIVARAAEFVSSIKGVLLLHRLHAHLRAPRCRSRNTRPCAPRCTCRRRGSCRSTSTTAGLDTARASSVRCLLGSPPGSGAANTVVGWLEQDKAARLRPARPQPQPTCQPPPAR